MTDILAGDVFPGLDKADPLASKDTQEKIPDKYGKNWFKFEAQKTTTQQGQTDDGESSNKQLETLEKDLDDMKGDVWNHVDN